MSLRWKIFLLSIFVALSVGLSSAYLFARAWQDLARGYGLAALDLRLMNFESREMGGWSLEKDASAPRWVVAPETAEASDSAMSAKLADEIVTRVEQTRLEEGSFEMFSDIVPGASYFLAFKRDGGVLRIAGLDASASLGALSPWAAPFLGAIVVALFVAAFFALFLSGQLNRDYVILERALENIGAGRLTNLNVPASGDPSVRSLGHALLKTAELLASKDKMIAEVSSLAVEDPMTGVLNYRAFENFVGGVLGGVKGSKGQLVLGIIDLDFFKKVNDSYGHQVGDFVLKETTRIVQSVLAASAKANPAQGPTFFGRYGGEEFVFILPAADASVVHVDAHRILQAIKSAKLQVPAEVSETGKTFELSISASIGLASWSSGMTSKESWVKEADQALYEAKRSGRGRVVMLRPEKREWT